MTYTARLAGRTMSVHPLACQCDVPELLDGLTLRLGQRRGHVDIDDRDEVAVTALHRYALALDAVLVARLGSGPQPDRDLAAVEQRDRHVAAERRLRERHRNPHDQVVALTREDRIGLDVNGDEQVASGTAVATWTAAPLQSDALAVGHPGRDADLHLALTTLHPRTPTRRAGVVDDDASALTVPARLAEREHALVVVDDATAVAHRTHMRGRAGPRAAPVAR